MLENPNLPDEKIISCLQAAYGLSICEVTFLPLGADSNTAVYRVVDEANTPYFLKLRSGAFDEMSVRLPKYFRDRGVEQIIAPLVTRIGLLWGQLDNFKVILYPFIEGRNGYEVAMSDEQWREFGAALKRLHTIKVPPALQSHLQPIGYSSKWREIVRHALNLAETAAFEEPVAIKVAACLRTNHAQILDLIERSERLAQTLQARLPSSIVCHTDLHAGNILLTDSHTFYIVDWDNPLLAPKERDLMFVGGGLFSGWRTPQEEETLFYQGYGQTEIDPVALAYFRYERIIEDIAIYCEELLLSDEGGADREQSYRYLISNFTPDGLLEITHRADRTRSD
jgi:spectinomycin phosphotransferase